MDLVVGATGTVGGGVARRLAEADRRVRALVRGGEGRAEGEALRRAGIDVADGDLTRPETLPDACQGVETVVCTATSMPHGRDDGLRRVDRDGVLALIEAAEQAGARRFVYVSYSGNIRRDSPLHQAKRGCERRLAESDLQAVVLRPSYFMDVWLSPALGVDPLSGTVRVYGAGDRPVSYIAAANVVDFAAAATRAELKGDQTLELGGPDALSQLDCVGIFQRELGREIAVERVPVEGLEEQHGSDDPLQRSFAALMLSLADGDAIPDARATAERFGVSLVSVADRARELAHH